MPETVALLGASGVLGRRLTPLLADAGFEVRALSRTPVPAAPHVTPVIVDILDADALPRAIDGCAVVVHAATSVPGARGGDWAVNDRIRREGTANLLAAAQTTGARRYIQQSVAMLLSTDDSRPQTEADPIAGMGVLASAIDMEALVREAHNSGLETCILRGGLFFGPGTGRLEAIVDEARAETWQVPGDGTRWLSPVHVDDMASAMAAVVAADTPPPVVNAVSDAPLTWTDLYRSLAQALDLEAPPAGGPETLPSFRVSNAALRSRGWACVHGDTSALGRAII